MNHNNENEPIVICNSQTQQQIPITETPINKHHKTLGIMENPNGSNKAETTRLHQISDEVARKITTTTLNAKDTEMLYKNYYLPRIAYALTVGTQTATQLHSIQSPVTHSILPAMGLNRHMPLEIVFGPKEIGGLGLRHLFAEQGTAKSIALLKHIRTSRDLGQALEIKLLWDQRIAGIGHSILSPPFDNCPQLIHEKWTTTLQEFLKQSQLEIIIPSHYTPTKKRTNDLILMDNINLKSGKINKVTAPAIMYINQCRLYLHAESLADICNVNGTEITKQAYDCLEIAQLNDQELWPLINRPRPNNIETWQAFLQYFCQPKSLKLIHPIGPWTQTPVKQQWQQYYNSTDNTAIIMDQTGWHCFTLHQPSLLGRRLHSQIPYEYNNETTPPPPYQIADMVTTSTDIRYIIPLTSQNIFKSNVRPTRMINCK